MRPYIHFSPTFCFCVNVSALQVTSLQSLAGINMPTAICSYNIRGTCLHEWAHMDRWMHVGRSMVCMARMAASLDRWFGSAQTAALGSMEFQAGFSLWKTLRILVVAKTTNAGPFKSRRLQRATSAAATAAWRRQRAVQPTTARHATARAVAGFVAVRKRPPTPPERCIVPRSVHRI